MFKPTIVLIMSMLVMVSGCDQGSQEKKSIPEPDKPANALDKKINEIEKQSTPEKIAQFKQLKDDDSSVLQQATVDTVKSQLPILIDKATLMSDVYLDHGIINYKLEVKGLPESMIKSSVWAKTLQKQIDTTYCSDDERLVMFRELFPAGVKYNYYVGEKLVYWYKVQPSKCDKPAQ